MSTNQPGNQRKSKYNTRTGSQAQDTLEVNMLQEDVARQQEAGPSVQEYDWSDDSLGLSDWVPQGETTEDDEDEDSDKDTKKRVKLERYRRQIKISSNKRKKATPSLRATPVLPKTMPPHKTSHVGNLQNDKRQPNKTLRDELVDIMMCLQNIANLIKPKTEGLKVIVPTKYKAENQFVEGDVTENEEANREHEESSSSNDNASIYNKYKCVKGFSAYDPSASGPSVSNPSEASLSNPSGYSASKKFKAENKDRPRYSQSDVEEITYLGVVKVREQLMKTLEDNLIPLVSNPSGSSASKKYKAENTDRTPKNRSVEKHLTENEKAHSEHQNSTSSDDNVLIFNKYKCVKGFSESYLSGPSVSNLSEPSVSNPSGSSTSKKYKTENKDRTRHNQSVKLDVSQDREDVAKLRNARAREAMIKMLEDDSRPSVSNPSRTSVSNPSRSSVSNPSRSLVSNPSRSSVSNPSRPSISKKYKAENTDLTGHHHSVEEDVSEDEEELALKLRDARARVVKRKMLDAHLRRSVSNPSGSSTSKMYKAENTNQTSHNQSVEEDVSADEEGVPLTLRDAKAREAMKKLLEANLRLSVSDPSESSTSENYKTESTDQTGHNQAVEEDVTEDEEAASEHEEFNRSDDNVLITNRHINITVKTVHKEHEWVPIGTGNTLIQREKYMKVNWKSYTIATRTLLLAVFPRRVLATHSLTGKKSPAFQDKPAKMCLDPKKVYDVIDEIKKRFNVKESLIRSIITTKCADECKMYKTRCQKNNENMPPATNEEDEY